MLVSRTWLQKYFDTELPSGGEIADLLTFGAFEIESVEEVEGDTVIDVDVLANRASDCLSHRGVAREISVLGNIPMTIDPFLQDIPEYKHSNRILLEIERADVCPVHVLARISGVKVGPSPAWLRKGLEALGQRSINNVVDATNYIMLMYGQPNHAFNAKKLIEEDGAVGINIRQARKGERITILGGEEKELDDTIAVLADIHSDDALDIAGVKGGTHAELTEATTDIVLSAAKFQPLAIRKTAQKVGIRTDAVKRFENEVPDALPHYAMEALVTLVLDIAGGTLIGYTATERGPAEKVVIPVSTRKVNEILGTSLSNDEIKALLTRLRFPYTESGDVINVTTPWERLDLQIPVNIVEEIGRVYGYRNIPGTQLPKATEPAVLGKEYMYAEKIRHAIAPLGFTEVLTYSLRDRGVVRLENSLASDKDHLREALAPGLSDALVANAHHMPLLGRYEDIRVFEIGRVFPSLDHEETRVAFGVSVAGEKKKESRINAIIDSALEAIEKELDVELNGESKDGIYEFSLTALLENCSDRDAVPTNPHIAGDVSVRPVVPFPVVLRDIALWTPSGTDKEEIEKTIHKNAGDTLVRLDQFDQFEKEGRVSYAYHLVFQAVDRTLTDAEIGEVMKTVEEAIRGAGWEVR